MAKKAQKERHKKARQLAGGPYEAGGPLEIWNPYEGADSNETGVHRDAAEGFAADEIGGEISPGLPDGDAEAFAAHHGPAESRPWERARFLGQLRERVLKALTFAQVEEEGVYPEILEAIRDPRARKLIISRDADLYAAREYIRLARENDLSFTTVDSPWFTGNIGLVVASDRAVDEPEIMVKSRAERLRELGVPESVISARGKPLCPSCYKLLQRLAPGEAQNYTPISWVDRLLGRSCAACGDKWKKH